MLENGLLKALANGHIQFYSVLSIFWLVLFITGKYSMLRFTASLLLALIFEAFSAFYFPSTNFFHGQIQSVNSIVIKGLVIVIYVYLTLTCYGSSINVVNASSILNTPEAYRYIDLLRSKLQ